MSKIFLVFSVEFPPVEISPDVFFDALTPQDGKQKFVVSVGKYDQEALPDPHQNCRDVIKAMTNLGDKDHECDFELQVI